ncbi:MAG: hypothetical protein LIO76_03555 [Clostridiales bacterium]|nr:hypothetical protein [Clostridiales bacterium]
MTKEIRSAQIIALLNEYNITYQFTWDQEVTISNYCPLSNLKENSITWVRHASDTPVTELNRLQDVLLVAELGAEIPGAQFPVIYAGNAHRTFFRILQRFFAEDDPENRIPGIENTAIVETENIGQDVYIGHHSFVGKDVTIGNHVQILQNVVIQGHVVIGDFSIIEPGVAIGGCGFGHYKDEEGINIRVPHLGGVRIGARVRIGANTCIARGCLDDTEIGDDSKIDTLCHIAHNVKIGKNTMIVSGCQLAGSSVVGDNVWMAPGTSIKNQVTVGNDAATGMNALITKNLDPGCLAVQENAKYYGERFKNAFFR